MSDETHRRTFDVNVLSQSLAQLHEFVTRCTARIEVTRPGTDERCVLLSKRELDCLEHALEILSDTDGVRDICGKIAMLASASNSEYAQA
jgi:hypothetical protein